MADLFNVTIHAGDPRRLGSFWSDALGYPVVTNTDTLVRLHRSSPSGAPDLLILKADALDPAKGRLHLDLAADDIDREVERLVGLGATLVDRRTTSKPHRRQANGIEWVVLADPEGNEFCVGSRPCSADISYGHVPSRKPGVARM